MRAHIKRLHTPDAPDLSSFEPPDETDFALLVQIIAGPSDSEGEESFDVEVITPKRLAARVQKQGPVSGRHLLVVNRFDPAEIQEWIGKAVASCSGGDWEGVAQRLGRIGYWEFEDYQE